MQQLSVTFARVIDVVRVKPAWYDRSTLRHTRFAFETPDGLRHQVTVLGHPVVYTGMSVVAVLRNRNDWNTLVGWVDQATGEIAGPQAVSLPLVMVVVAVGSAGAVASAVSDDWAFAAGFVAATCGALLALRNGINRNAAFREIQRRVLERAS